MLEPVFLGICALAIATASLSFACYGLPSPTTTRHADVAQLVAHNLAKVRVAGSSPVIRSTEIDISVIEVDFRRWISHRFIVGSPTCAISSAGERFPDTEEVTGSIPVSRTAYRSRLKIFIFLLRDESCGCSAVGSA